MAKKITMYEANDGTQFDCLDLARAHDMLCNAVVDATARLSPVPKGDFGNDRRGYLQQDPAAVLEVKVRLVEIAAGIGMRWFKEHLAEAHGIHPMSVAGRFMDDGAPEPLARAWGRLQRIDDKGREWEQPYFALNPEEGCQHPYGREPVEAEGR